MGLIVLTNLIIANHKEMNENLTKELLNQFSNGTESILNFVINIAISILLSILLGFIYNKYGSSLSNKKKLAESFVLLCVTTLVIITIVKSSLALSLGLVGALSIVRFRTAIKEPEELVYFFIAIAIGLGLGADQKVITITGVLCIFIYIIVRNAKSIKKDSYQNLIVTINNFKDIDENDILELLKLHCDKVELHRIDDSSEVTELALNVSFKSFNGIMDAKNGLKKIGGIQFSFIENY